MPFIDSPPIAAAERLARYERDTFNADCDGITAALVQWRDRERLNLTTPLLVNIAQHVTRERKAA
jgi:hypothetical protein